MSCCANPLYMFLGDDRNWQACARCGAWVHFIDGRPFTQREFLRTMTESGFPKDKTMTREFDLNNTLALYVGSETHSLTAI